MEFYTVKDESLQSPLEKLLWNALKIALKDEPGACFAQYPVFGRTGHIAEIDVLVAHPDWGLFIFEVKGYRIDQIGSIDDNKWMISGNSFHNPYHQSINLLQALFFTLNRQIDIDPVLQGHIFIALLDITRKQWDASGYGKSDKIPNTLFADELAPEILRTKLQSLKPKSDYLDKLTENEATILLNTLKQIYNDQILMPQPDQVEQQDSGDEVIEEYQRDVASIFISYRRRDSAWAVRYLRDYLDNHFSKSVKLFLDVDTIGFGDRFDQVIEEEIKRSNVILVIIGPQWMHLSLPNSMRRLDDPNDPVVREIAMAINYKKKVIPVLLDDVEMPRDTDLPAAIANLSLYHAFKLTPDTFHTQMPFLIKRLESLLKTTQEIIEDARNDIAEILKSTDNNK